MGVSQNDGRMEGWYEFYQLFCCWVCLNLHPLCKHGFTFFDFSGLNGSYFCIIVNFINHSAIVGFVSI